MPEALEKSKSPSESQKPAQLSYDVLIAGVPLKLRSSHDEERVHQLISLVDFKVREAISNSKGSSFQNSLLLAALHLAEDLIELRDQTDRELQHLESQARRVLLEVETSLSQ